MPPMPICFIACTQNVLVVLDKINIQGKCLVNVVQMIDWEQKAVLV